MTVLAARPGNAGACAGDGTADAYVRTALADLAAIRTSAEWGWLGISRPRPTAAFSRRDTLAAGYPQAVETARRHRFEPVVRPAGGHLAAYHEGALLLDVVARHPSPAAEVDRRFGAFADAVASALRTLGADARVGPVAGEYCPGRFSVNVGGRQKVAGTAQRLTGGSFLLTAVVVVSDPEPIRAVLSATYPQLGLAWDPTTVGCLQDVDRVSTDEVQAALLDALAELLPLGPRPAGPSGTDLRVPLVDCWQLAG